MLDPIKIFSVYSREDKAYLEEFKKNLSPLIRGKAIEFWYDQEIKPGEIWEAIISDQISKAEIIMLLISADFLDSDFINSNELPKALERRDKGEVEIIPIIVRDCNWRAEKRISQLQIIPSGAKPIEEWPYKNKAYAIVSSHLSDYIDKLRVKKAIKNDINLATIEYYSSTGNEHVYNYFVEQAEQLLKGKKYEQALVFYEEAKKRQNDNYSKPIDYILKKIKECKYGVEIHKGYTAMFSRKYADAIVFFEGAYDFYIDSFDPSKSQIETSVIECKIYIYQARAQQLLNNGQYNETLAIVNEGLLLNENNQELKRIKKEIERHNKEIERHNSAKEMFKSLILEAQSYEDINWPEALKAYKKSLNYHYEDFEIKLDTIKDKIAFCEKEIVKIQEKSKKVRINLAKFTSCIEDGNRNLSNKKFKEALGNFKKSMDYYEVNFTPNERSIREKIQLIENSIFQEHKQNSIYFYNQGNLEESFKEFKLSIEYPSKDRFFEKLHKIEEQNVFINALEEYLHKTRKKPEYFKYYTILKILGISFTNFIPSYFYYLITYRLFYHTLGIPFFNFIFILIPISVAILYSELFLLLTKIKINVYIGSLVSSVIFVYFNLFFQYTSTSNSSYADALNVQVVFGNLNSIIEKCYINQVTFLMELVMIVPVSFYIVVNNVNHKSYKIASPK